MAVAILVAISLPGPGRAQSSSDAAPLILLHPDVATIIQLPDEIAHARVLDRDELRVAAVGDKLVLRPWPGTPAGMDALLDVETRTARWTFRLRVVARARDANRNVRMPRVWAPTPEASISEAPPALLAEPVVSPPVVAPEIEPVVDAPTSAVSPAAPPARAAQADAAGMERDNATTHAPRFDLSAHVVGGVGFTGLDVAGHQARVAVQAHHEVGLRLVGTRPDASWALETHIHGEWPSGSMTYGQDSGAVSQLEVSGPRLRAELGVRPRLGARWIFSTYAGLGVQVHLRRTRMLNPDGGGESVREMKRNAVLSVGVGLQYRVCDALFGVEFQMRQGVPDDYRSVAVLWSVGYLLEQGE